MTKDKESNLKFIATEEHWLQAILKLKGYKSVGVNPWHFTGKSDPRFLAGLLRITESPPRKILDLLATLLEGGGVGGCPKVSFSSPKNPIHFEKLIENLLQMREVHRRYIELKKSGKNHKQALFELENEFSLKKRTWLHEAIALEDDKFLQAIIDGATPDSAKRRTRKTVSSEVFEKSPD